MKITPNPNGRKGGERHQQKVDEVADKLNKKGYTVVYEFFIRTLSGLKNRFADIVAFDKSGKIKEIHQIGKKNENGTPIARERKAIDDIEKSTGNDVTFTSYNFVFATVVFLLVVICVFLLLSFIF